MKPQGITITKEFSFDAAHWLPNLPAGHKCTNLHGHTYRVVIQCTGPIDPGSGMLMDYADIAAAWAPIHAILDHRCLNGNPAWPANWPTKGPPAQEPIHENPTTENIAHWIKSRLKALPGVVVRVYESSSTYAETCPE